MSDDTKELIMETKKDLSEIERVVQEYQARQSDMKKVINKAESELDRLEEQELDILKRMKRETVEKKSGSTKWTLVILSAIFIVFLGVLIQYSPFIEYIYLCFILLHIGNRTCSWEFLNEKWQYLVETVFEFVGLPKVEPGPY